MRPALHYGYRKVADPATRNGLADRSSMGKLLNRKGTRKMRADFERQDRSNTPRVPCVCWVEPARRARIGATQEVHITLRERRGHEGCFRESR